MAAHTRPAFLRWMAFCATAIYAHYWIRDDPTRVIDGEEAGRTVKARIGDRFIECWRIMEAQTDPGRYILGDDLTVLDLYVAVMTRWAGGRARFNDAAPRLAEVARRVDADPRLQDFWAERFPFK